MDCSSSQTSQTISLICQIYIVKPELIFIILFIIFQLITHFNIAHILCTYLWLLYFYLKRYDEYKNKQ